MRKPFSLQGMKNVVVLPTDKTFKYLAENGYKIVHKPKEIRAVNPVK